MEEAAKEMKFLTAEGAELGLNCPPMRVIDEGMWCLGLEAPNREAR